MLIPFFKQKEGDGARFTQGFGGKYYPKPMVQVWRFPEQTERHRPWGKHKPRTTFAMKKEQHPSWLRIWGNNEIGKQTNNAQNRELKRVTDSKESRSPNVCCGIETLCYVIARKAV